MDFKNQSYYDILEVTPNASFNDIKTAYYRIKNTYSKDSPALYTLFNDDETKELLSKVEIAYLVLSNPEKRREYDKTHGFMGFMADASEKEAANKPHDSNVEYAGLDNLMGGTDNTFSNNDVPSSGMGSFGSFSGTLGGAKPKVTTSFYEEPVHEMPAQNPVSVAPLSQPQQKNIKTTFTGNIAPHIPIKDNVLSVIRRHNIIKNYAESNDMEKRISEEQDFHGVFLREVREYKNVSIEEISDFTKIGKSYLQAIEDENFKKLPARVFVRGFVAQVAKALKLDQDKVTNAYMKHYDNVIRK